MKYAQIFALGTILATLSLLVGGGCSTTGNGRLDIDAGAAIEAAAAGASGDYAKAFAKIQELLDKRKAIGQDISVTMKALGYTEALTLYFDGMAIEDHQRFGYKQEWFKAGGGVDAVMLATGTKTNAGAVVAEFDDLISQFVDVLSDVETAK